MHTVTGVAGRGSERDRAQDSAAAREEVPAAVRGEAASREAADQGEGGGGAAEDGGDRETKAGERGGENGGRGAGQDRTGGEDQKVSCDCERTERGGLLLLLLCLIP